jgi:hypothetical protein
MSGFSQKKLPDYAARTKRKKLEVIQLPLSEMAFQ